jgi:TetR/AcrR family transcriptional regulator
MIKSPGEPSRAPSAVAADGAEAATERRILEAAHAVFIRTGTAGARMQEIAREAGVNSALLHYYFRSKERLAEAVFRRAAGELLPEVIGILSGGATLAEKVERVIAVEIDHLARSPYLPVYILSELAHHPERLRQLLSSLTGQQPEAIGQRLITVLGRQIRAGVRAGAIRAIAPEQFIVNLLSLCIFPFAARPMLTVILGFDDPAFRKFIDQRRRDLPPFFLNALRP